MQQAMISSASTRREQLKLLIASRALASPEGRLSSPRFPADTDELFPPDSFFSTPKEFELGASGISPSAALPGSGGSVSLHSSSITFLEQEEASAATESRLYLARLTLQYQEIADRYHLCLSHLHEAAEEAEALHRENAALRLANADLTKRLSILASNRAAVAGPGWVPTSSISSGATSLASTLSNELRRLRVAEPLPDEKSPTSVLAYGAGGDNRLVHQQPAAAAAERRVTLPKSISIRSSGYLKLNPSSGSGSTTNRAGRIRVSSPVMIGPQRMLVGGGGRGNKEEEEEKEEGEVEDGEAPLMELEAYSQGMFKTELCNKWEEKEECPYGENCQFAHGIAELRPVIRHPRYKTEVCRMVLAGDACPYGHRCHFRHTLTPSDLPLGP